MYLLSTSNPYEPKAQTLPALNVLFWTVFLLVLPLYNVKKRGCNYIGHTAVIMWTWYLNLLVLGEDNQKKVKDSGCIEPQYKIRQSSSI